MSFGVVFMVKYMFCRIEMDEGDNEMDRPLTVSSMIGNLKMMTIDQQLDSITSKVSYRNNNTV